MDWVSHIQKKIFLSLDDFLPTLNNWRENKNRIVFTNGCFDILHSGHLSLINQAAALGDRLIVGLNSDSSVRLLKGVERPIQKEKNRAELLAAFEPVSAVVLFSEETPLHLIETISPDFLVKGGDYTINQIVGADFVHNHGGKVITVPFLEGFSTTSIIDCQKRVDNF